MDERRRKTSCSRCRRHCSRRRGGGNRGSTELRDRTRSCCRAPGRTDGAGAEQGGPSQGQVPAASRNRGVCRSTSLRGHGPADAKRNDGIDQLLAELLPLLPEQALLFEPDTLSDQPERFFVSELVREQVLLHTRQEVPHGVAVVVERFDESVKPPRIEVVIHVAREAHTKILVGTGGRMVKSIGTAARARIERMLGGKIHLELSVRATPDWMNSEARLREMGYGPRAGDD